MLNSIIANPMKHEPKTQVLSELCENFVRRIQRRCQKFIRKTSTYAGVGTVRRQAGLPANRCGGEGLARVSAYQCGAWSADLFLHKGFRS